MGETFCEIECGRLMHRRQLSREISVRYLAVVVVDGCCCVAAF